jgi:hypothetical protein
LISWKYSFEKISKDLEVTRKKKQALDDLFNSGKISASTYGSLEKELTTIISDIEMRQKILADNLALKVGDLEKQISTLELFLANSEIQYVAGEINEELHASEIAAFSNGLDSLKNQLESVKTAVATLMPEIADEQSSSETVEPEPVQLDDLTTEETTDVSVDIPTEPPVEVPVETAAETPVMTPEIAIEAPTEAPVEEQSTPSVEIPVQEEISEVAVDVPSEMPIETPEVKVEETIEEKTPPESEIPIEEEIDTNVEAPSEAPSEISDEGLGPAGVAVEEASSETIISTPEVPVKESLEATNEQELEAPGTIVKEKIVGDFTSSNEISVQENSDVPVEETIEVEPAFDEVTIDEDYETIKESPEEQIQAIAEKTQLPSTEEITEVEIVSQEPTKEVLSEEQTPAEVVSEETNVSEESTEAASEEEVTAEAEIEEEIADEEELTIEGNSDNY